MSIVRFQSGSFTHMVPSPLDNLIGALCIVSTRRGDIWALCASGNDTGINYYLAIYGTNGVKTVLQILSTTGIPFVADLVEGPDGNVYTILPLPNGFLYVYRISPNLAITSTPLVIPVDSVLSPLVAARTCLYFLRMPNSSASLTMTTINMNLECTTQTIPLPSIASTTSFVCATVASDQCVWVMLNYPIDGFIQTLALRIDTNGSYLSLMIPSLLPICAIPGTNGNIIIGGISFNLFPLMCEIGLDGVVRTFTAQLPGLIINSITNTSDGSIWCAGSSNGSSYAWIGNFSYTGNLTRYHSFESTNFSVITEGSDKCLWLIDEGASLLGYRDIGLRALNGKKQALMKRCYLPPPTPAPKTLPFYNTDSYFDYVMTHDVNTTIPVITIPKPKKKMKKKMAKKPKYLVYLSLGRKHTYTLRSFFPKHKYKVQLQKKKKDHKSPPIYLNPLQNNSI